MKFPEMRKELIGYLKDLSNLDYQKKCWVLKQCPEGIENDELDYAIHFLYDDTALASNSNKLIGYCLKNEAEALAIKSLCDSMDLIFDKYGYDKTDDDYINCPEWENVIDSAKNALSIISPVSTIK